MSEDGRPPTDRDFLLDDVIVRPGLHRLERGGRTVRVEPRVMAVLVDLAAAAPRTVTRDELLAAHWPRHVSDDALNRALWKLRRAIAELGGDGDREWVETVPKKGYRLRVTPAAPKAEDERAELRGQETRRPVLPAIAVVALLALTAAALRQRVGSSSPEPRAPAADATPLTSLPGYESSPTFSADGRWVFSHYEKDGERALQWDLFVRYADGREERLTETPDHEFGPVWSPDGVTLAYVRATDTTCRIVVRAGGEERELGCALDDGGPLDSWAQLAWTPDGVLVVSDRRGRGEPRRLRLLEPSSGRTTILTDPPAQSDGDSWPAVSPDGRRVAFVRSRSAGREDLWTRELGSGAERRLTFDTLPLAGVAWSADGDSLVYSSRRSGTYRLWRLPASGGEAAPVPAVGRNLTGPRPAPGGFVYEEWQSRINLWRLELGGDGAVGGRPWIESVRWSWMPAADPAGGRVAFLSDRDGAVEVWLAGEANGQVRRLTDLDLEVAPRLSWSPDGTSIVLDFPARGSYDLHLLDVATGEVERLTEDASDERVPVFTPDGRSIVFASDREDGWQLWSLDRSTGVIERLTAGGGFAAAPSPDGRFLYLVRRDEAGIWRRPLAAGPDVESELWVAGFPAVDWPAWTVVGAGVVFLGRDPGGPSELRLRDEAGARVLAVLEGPKGPLHEVWTESSLVADGDLRHFVVAGLDHSESDLWLLRMDQGTSSNRPPSELSSRLP